MSPGPTKSSHVSGVDYDEPSTTLTVTFSNGAVYNYFGVSKSTYEEMLAASSWGEYLAKYVRNAYRYIRVR